MSSVGFKPPNNEDLELKQLREAVDDLNSVLRNAKDGKAQLKAMNLGLLEAHLDNILFFGRKAKRTITEIGKGKKKSTLN